MNLKEKEVRLTEYERPDFRNGGRVFRLKKQDENMLKEYVSDKHNKKVFSYRTKPRLFDRKGNKLRNVSNKFAKKTANRTLDNVSSEKGEEPSYENEATREAERGIKRVMGIAGVMVTSIVKATISLFSSVVGIIVLILGITIATLIISVQTITYSVIVDEEANIKALISQVSSELSNNINELQMENECDIVSTSGKLADWKEIIALWWTLKMHISDEEQYDDYFNGDDYEDINYLFYQFNQISYDVSEPSEENAKGKRILNIKITNTSLDNLRNHWGLDEAQNKYLDELLADDEIWEELLFSNELASIAYGLIGQSASIFIEWYPLNKNDNWDAAFVMYCLEQAGYIDAGYFDKTHDTQNFIIQCMEKGWFEVLGKPTEGDIIFLNINGTQMSGIVVLADADTFNVIMGNYTNKDVVYELTLQYDSSLITGYAHIDGLFMPGLNNILVGSGNYVWPVPGYYYVTSCFGHRINPTTGEGIEGHSGMDVGCPIGTPIVSVSDGVVSAAYYGNGYNGGMGIYVIVEHTDGLSSIYMHNSELCVEDGDIVKAGQVIAYSGNTGRSTGPHHHLSIVSDGERIDPAPFFDIPVSIIGDVSIYIN